MIENVQEEWVEMQSAKETTLWKLEGTICSLILCAFGF